MLHRKIRRILFDETDILRLLGHPRSQPQRLRELIGRKWFSATRIGLSTPTGRGRPPPLIAYRLMQQVLTRIQFMAKLGEPPCLSTTKCVASSL